MSTLVSYDLNGKKLSFANWISNLSPQSTPFTSMTGKESIDQTLFQWQNDSLTTAGMNATKEGAKAVAHGQSSTTVRHNITQILRKVVKVSETANSTANYGRGKELQYQMEKAGKELKRDLEWAFLNNGVVRDEEGNKGRLTAGFSSLVAPIDAIDPDTKAKVHFNTKDAFFTEAELFEMTYNLYLSGSLADTVMYHPKHASFFSSLQEKSGGEGSRVRIFEDTPKYSVFVSKIVDPLGQEYKLIPNRFMPQDKIYFFNPKSWTQMVLRAPQRVKLAKDGSYEKWMIECEVGLRHKNPFASGCLVLKPAASIDYLNNNYFANEAADKSKNPAFQFTSGGTKTKVALIAKNGESYKQEVTVKAGSKFEFQLSGKVVTPPPPPPPGARQVNISAGSINILKDGVKYFPNNWEFVSNTESANVTSWTFDGVADDKKAKVLKESITKEDAGFYSLRIDGPDGTIETPAISIYVSDAEGNDPNIQKPLSLTPVVEEVPQPVKKTRKQRTKKVAE